MRAQARLVLFSVLFLALGCQGVELKETTLPQVGDLKNNLGIKEIPYIYDDTFLGNPLATLGQVVEIRKSNNLCTSNIEQNEVTFVAEKVIGFNVDEGSIIKQPIKRNSAVVDKELAASMQFLNYLSLQLDSKSISSIIVFDEMTGRVKDDAQWSKSLDAWKKANKNLFEDDNVCYLWVVKGFVQKNIIRRQFTKVSGSAGGGAYGLNLGGEYYTSADDNSVDIKFGLSPGILKRPKSMGAETLLMKISEDEELPTETDSLLLKNIMSIKRR